MFNVKVKRFYDTEQVQVFSKGFRSKGEVEKVNFNHFTGEIYENAPKRGELIENPFNDMKPERMTELPDLDESARISFCRAKKKIYDIARSNMWEWFLTFTFNGEKVERYSYGECTKKLSVWLMNMRKECPDMVYLVIPEQHKDGAFHFHGLFANVEGLNFEDSGKLDDEGRKVYNVGKYRWGFTTATQVTDYRKASSYLCKYVTKDMCAVSRGKKKYWSSRNVKLPEVQELLLEESTDERIQKFLEGHTYIKRVRTPYTDVTYIERPM